MQDLPLVDEKTSLSTELFLEGFPEFFREKINGFFN